MASPGWRLPPLLTLLLAMLLGQTGFAQTFSIVGTGTGANTNTGYPAPFGNWYYGAKHQFLVTAAELGSAGVPAGSSISSIGYNVTATNGAAPHQNYQVKVFTTTTADPISAGYVTTGLVAQSTATTVTPVVGWNQSALVTAFAWDGTSNLVIETCFNNTTYTYNASTQWTSTLSGATYSRWYNADAGGVCANTSAFSTSTTTRPNIRFGWAGGSACVGNPVPGNTTSTSPNACPSGTFTLGTQFPTLGSGVSYQWQTSSTSAGPWTNVGPNGSTYTASQTVPTWYQVIVTCSGGGSGTSNPLQVGMSPAYNCACTSSATSTFDEEILNVTFGSLNNSSLCNVAAPGPGSVASMYSNFKTLPAPSVEQLQLVSYSVQLGTCNGSYSNRVAIFIDWNQNGLLTDPGEDVLLSAVQVGPHTVTGTIQVPISATAGTTLMRVVNVETTGTIAPCGTYSWGETEDYLINVTVAPPCAGTPAPGNTTASTTSACSGSTITLGLQNQTGGTEVTYQWQVSTTSAGGPWTNFGPNAAGTTATQTVQSWYQAIVTCTNSGA
ncbi:MAG: GEVED domain-containing protein, partial [Bacteroidota bacterium]|nr:GEVED domain-containing protein [Bacteroidota bacterium]